jgi:large subunit ribosomal protein L9
LRSSRLPCRPQYRNGTNIPVILMQDFDDKGSVGDIIEVKRGHARNLLIPRKIAVYATRENKVKFAKDDFGAKEVMEDVKNKLEDGTIISFKRAADNKGNLFGLINVGDIANHIRLTMDKSPNNIFLPSPIKKLGRHIIIADGVEIIFEVSNITN